MVVIMKKTALLGVLALFAVPQSMQCSEEKGNFRVFTRNGLNLFLCSPKAGEDIADQKEAIIDFASMFEDDKAIIIVNDNTYMTPEFLKVFPKSSYDTLYQEHKNKYQNADQVFTALAKQDTIKKINIAFDYFFDCPSCTLLVVKKTLHQIGIELRLNAAQNENDRYSALAKDQKTNIYKHKKIYLNRLYMKAIQMCEKGNRHMFVCVNADEVDELIEKVLKPLKWQKPSPQQLQKMLPKPKPSFFSWQTMTALAAGAASFGFLGLVAYKNNIFGRRGWLHRAAVLVAAKCGLPALYRQLINMG